jgi:hypothetical protein
MHVTAAIQHLVVVVASASTAFFSVAVSPVVGSSMKCVWPGAMTPNGLSTARRLGSRALGAPVR